MNNIIIAWAPLSWKSTLGKEIWRQIWGSHIPMDPLVSAIGEYFPESWIWHWWISSIDIWKSASSEFSKFLDIYIQWYNSGDSYNKIILEGFHINFEELWVKYNKNNQIIVIGYPDITVEEKMKYTRMVDSKNWTVQKDDQYLSASIWFFIELSKYFRERCHILWIPFINTSTNFKEVIQSSVTRLIDA